MIALSRPQARSKNTRGALVPGTLCKVDADCGHRFRLSDRHVYSAASTAANAQLPVSFAGCVLPDPFRDWPGYAVELIVEGNRRCQSCHDFEASSVWARGGGAYEMGPRGSPYPPAGSEAPRCLNAM